LALVSVATAEAGQQLELWEKTAVQRRAGRLLQLLMVLL
jgi:hypothetical protein